MLLLPQLALTLAVFRRKIRLGLLALLRHPMGIFDNIIGSCSTTASYFETDLAGRHVSRRMVTASASGSSISDDDYPSALINRIYNFFRKTGALLLS